MNKIKLCAPITFGGAKRIACLTFDGCFYYCAIKCRHEIIKLNRCLEPLQSFAAAREYGCLCFDFREGCFWASSEACPNTLFKLDGDMREIACFTLRGLGEGGLIKGISYNCREDTLLIASAETVVEFEKRCESRVLIHRGDSIRGLLSTCCYILILREDKKGQFIEVWTYDKRLLACFYLDSQYILNNLICKPCRGGCCVPGRIEGLFYKKGLYPYLCGLEFSASELDCPPFCRGCASRECCCFACPPPPEDGCAQVLSSIARMEAALAHILNAEGEKLQKIIEKSDDIDTILRANREVNKTLIHVTHLEQALYAKLSALTESDIREPCGELYG